MPCEGCQVEFTVFQRKRSCTDCKRYYCSNCLSTAKRTAHHVPRCLRCAIFAKRPLLRADLLQLKPKDLIFYLQSKHISTTGCVEKDELVGLVLNHVIETDATSPRSNSSPHSHTNGETTHTFNALKQTCQNFFSNITDNISDSFASFDGKSTKSAATRNEQRPSEQATATAADGQQEMTHVFEQPRVSTREIPTYASFQNSSRSAPHSSTSPSTSSPSPTNTEMPASARSPQSGPQSRQMSTPSMNDDSQSSRQTAQRPVVSPSAMMARPSFNEEFPERNSYSSANNPRPGAKSDCECSDNDEEVDDDDDPVAIFSELSSNRAESRAQLEVESKSPMDQVLAGSSTSPEMALDESSQSSFEELGAIGGISDDSKAATTDTNSSNMEQWQLLGTSSHQRGNFGSIAANGNVENDVIFAEKLQVALLPVSHQHPPQPPTAPLRVKKVVRRRSDSYLNRRRRPLSDEESSPTNTGALKAQIGSEILHEQAEGEEVQNEDEDEGGTSVEGRQGRRRHNNCKRCGKNKTNIKRHVEKMRRQLESSQMSEEDIKRELKAFLVYLEKRTKSMDYSDTEDPTTAASSSFSGTNLTRAHQSHQANLFDSDSEGIHVYGGSDYTGIDSRFINLDDFDSLRELECLSVKQLKEVLMLNRVDYKGCCEKQELLERVERLWKNLKTCPAVEKLQTDELCKICMDAPIECVILECGHMATCTSCGKVLSECPICRQYIVRVVRFFRA